MILFVLIVPTLMLLFTFWGTWTLPASKSIRILLFLLIGGGFVYGIPIGPMYSTGAHLPLWLAQFLGTITAISITFVAILFARLLIVVVLSVSSFYTSFKEPVSLQQKNTESNTCHTWRSKRNTVLYSKKLSLIILAFAIIFGSYSAYEAMRIPRVAYHNIEVENLPKALEGYTIAQITDTHLGVIFRKEWMEKVVDKVNALNADLIVHTGDIADADAQDILEMLEPLKQLHAPDGVFYALGNHENIHLYQSFIDYYEENNFKYMEDGSIIFDRVPLELSIASAGRRPMPTDFEKIFKNVTKKEAHEKGLFRLHLDHFPSRAPEAAQFVDMQLSGHTHGGMTFFLKPIIAAANRGFVNGLYVVQDPTDLPNKERKSMLLYVSSTTGLWSYAPLRLLNPSEIALLRLVNAKK